MTLHERAERLRETAHLGERYDYREYSGAHKEKAGPRDREAQKPTQANDDKSKTKEKIQRKRCEGCNNDPERQKAKKCVSFPSQSVTDIIKAAKIDEELFI